MSLHVDRPTFFKICKALETEYAELKDCPSRPKLLEKLGPMLNLQISVSTLDDAIAATGLSFEFRRVNAGSKTKPTSKTWRYVRNLTRQLIYLYQKLGEEVPEVLKTQLKEMASDTLVAEPEKGAPPVDEGASLDALKNAPRDPAPQPITKPEKK